MKGISLVFCLIVASASAQTVTVKSSPASDALVQAAKQEVADQASLDALVKQYREQQSKITTPLQNQLQTVSKELNEKVQADKKYKKYFAQIADIQKKLEEAQKGTGADSALIQQANTLSQKLQSDKAQVEALTPIVRKENGLSDSDTFDLQKGWTAPEKK